MRQQMLCKSANQRPSSRGTDFRKQICKQLHVSSRNVLQITSEFTSAFKCSYKCSLSNSNFNSNFLEFQTVVFRLPQTIGKPAQTYLFALAFLSVVLLFSQVLNRITTVFRLAQQSLFQTNFYKPSLFRSQSILNKCQGTYYDRNTNLIVQYKI